MGENAERVKALLSERPMTTNEMALRIFGEMYSNSDKEICSPSRKLNWGRSRVLKGLSTLRSFGEVDCKMIPSPVPNKKEVQQWYLIERR